MVDANRIYNTTVVCIVANWLPSIQRMDSYTLAAGDYLGIRTHFTILILLSSNSKLLRIYKHYFIEMVNLTKLFNMCFFIDHF